MKLALFVSLLLVQPLFAQVARPTVTKPVAAPSGPAKPAVPAPRPRPSDAVAAPAPATPAAPAPRPADCWVNVQAKLDAVKAAEEKLKELWEDLDGANPTQAQRDAIIQAQTELALALQAYFAAVADCQFANLPPTFPPKDKPAAKCSFKFFMPLTPGFGSKVPSLPDISQAITDNKCSGILDRRTGYILPISQVTLPTPPPADKEDWYYDCINSYQAKSATCYYLTQLKKQDACYLALKKEHQDKLNAWLKLCAEPSWFPFPGTIDPGDQFTPPGIGRPYYPGQTNPNPRPGRPRIIRIPGLQPGTPVLSDDPNVIIVPE